MISIIQMNWLDIENNAVKWENTVLIFTDLLLEGGPIFSYTSYQCHSNTTLDKIVVSCINTTDFPYKKFKRPEETTIDCYYSFEVIKKKFSN